MIFVPIWFGHEDLKGRTKTLNGFIHFQAVELDKSEADVRKANSTKPESGFA